MRVGLAGLRGLGELARASGEFEMGMAKVAAISDIATDSTEALMLETTALAAAMKTQFSPKEATDGLAQFAGAGFNATQQANSLVPALRLAQAGMISVEDSSRSMTAAMKVFGIESEQAGIVTDKLLKIANLTDLQASDLALALGTVGRGASAAKQDLDEMLISMGLVKNTGVQASVAASSVSSALLFMANNAAKFDAIGVKVTNADGSFRDFIDVVMDTHTALGSMTDEAERAATASDLFGKFGLTAFQAVSTQITNGVQTATGEVLKGADAVAYLRTQLGDAAGTAEEFEAKILGTFEGQSKLLKGMGEAIKVSVGKPLLELSKKLIQIMLPLAERFVNFVNSLPPKFKTTLAGITVGVLALTVALGGLFAVASVAKFFGPLFATSLGALTPVVGTLLAIVAAGAAVYATFRLVRNAADRDLGGIGKTAMALWQRLKLFARAIGQLFSRGAIQGDVLSQLLTEEFAGVRKFVGGLIRIGARIKAFFQGLGAGFAEVINKAEPVWTNFKESIFEVVVLLRKLFGTVSSGAKGPLAEFTARGASVGRVFGKIVTFAVDIVGALVRFWTGFVQGVLAAKDFFQPLLDSLSSSFGALWDAIKLVLTELGLFTESGSINTEVWTKLGKALGWVVSVAIMPLVAGLTGLVKVSGFVFRTIGRLIGWVKTKWAEFREELATLQAIEDKILAKLTKFASVFKKVWQGIVDFVTGVFDDLKASLNGVLDFIAEIASKIPSKFRPEFLDEFIAARQGTGSGAVGGRLVQLAGVEQGNAVERARASSTSYIGGLVERKKEKDAAARAAAGDQQQMTGRLLSAIEKIGSGDGVLPQIKLIVDGRALATRVEKATQRNDALAFEGG
jgi:TP901 family phage tail tape measure protein